MTGRRISRLVLGALLVVGLSGLGLVSAVGASAPGQTGAPVGRDASSTGLLSTNFWLASAQGNVWSFGNAGSYGSAGGLHLAHPIVGITPTPRSEERRVGKECS